LPPKPSLRLLIADDEPLIRSGIRATLTKLSGIELTTECESGSEALRIIREQSPNLVLLDVRMPDYTGLEVIHEVGPERMPMVIFITAYDEYAIQAFELNAVDYLLKPFDEDRLIQSIDRARERLTTTARAEWAARLEALLLSQPKRTSLDRLAVRSKDGFEMVALDAVDWLQANDNYVELHSGNRVRLVHDTLTNLERQLDPTQFARVHRSRIVNISRIVKIAPLANGAYSLMLRNGATVTTGRLYRDVVLGLLGGR
jgi:two-component system, LytTR family, response regulator